MPTIYRILVIDDDPTVAELVKGVIEEFSGRSIICLNATTLADGIAMCKTQPNRFNLAVLDSRLPDADGLNGLEEFLREVPEVAVIMLTGFYEEARAIEARSKGAQEYLAKPIRNPELFLELIARALDRHRRTFELTSRISEQDTEIVTLKAEIKELKDKMNELHTNSQSGREDVDKRLKTQKWATIGGGIMLLLANDKFLDLMGKLIHLIF